MTESPFRRQLRQVALERVRRIRAQLDAEEPDAGRAEALREAHTLKGEARMTGHHEMADVTHELEELLGHADPIEAAPAIAECLARLERMAAGAVIGDERSGADPWERAPDLRHALLQVELHQVSELTRACTELRASQRESRALAMELSRLVRDARHVERGELVRRLRRLTAQARELAFEQGQRTDVLEEDLRAVRMLPISRLFDHVKHAAEELADQLGRDVELQIRGEVLAIDRQVLDAISAPLLHLVRNAIDHGVEPPEERVAAGKPARATIALRARQVDRDVEITLEEDGRGVDLTRVRASLVERGLLLDEQAAAATDDAIVRRIFDPGFTTRRTASQVSGRGIGLDVVRRQTEAIGGTVDVRTQPGEGTRFTLRVPASLVGDAVVMAEVNGAFHAFSISEVVTVRKMSSLEVGRAGDAEVVRIDDRTIALRDLGELLGMEARPGREALVVVAAESAPLAVAVDRVSPVTSAVRHGLDPFLRGLQVVRGTVTVGDRLSTLLDARELCRRAAQRPPRPSVEAPVERRAVRVLVVDDSELARDVLVATLRGLGCEVREADNGARALEALGIEAAVAAPPVDLVLTDLDMPVLDGFGLLHRVRAAEGTRRLPVIVLTTRAAPEDLRRASELGADAYLSKSDFRPAELARLIEHHVGRPPG